MDVQYLQLNCNDRSLANRFPVGKASHWGAPLKIHYETPIYKGYFPRGIPKQLFLGSIQVFRCERIVGGLATAIVQIGVIYELWKSAHFGSIFQDQFYGFGFAPAVGEMSILGFSGHFKSNPSSLRRIADCRIVDCWS